MNEPILLFALVGVLLIVVAVPMLLRRVPPNPFYGLRVPATYKDEQVWYDANAAAGRDLVLLGIFISLFAVVPPLFGWSGASHALAWSFAIAAGSLVMTALGWKRANRMLEAKSATTRKEN